MLWPTVQFSRSGEKRLTLPTGSAGLSKLNSMRARGPLPDWSTFRDGLGARAPGRTLATTIASKRDRRLRLPRKEVIQPHLPVRLPCYDFTPIASPTFDGSLPKGWATGFGCCPLSWCDGRCVQGPGTYSPQHC